ncbi:hypothetical protein [Streptomyces sp. NBC_01589]|uniref:hypothetical protein n=1 Tax=unclassified Streptomyces TaxID=2593676 RepID=UPI003870E7A4
MSSISRPSFWGTVEAFMPMGDPDQTLGLYTVEPGSPSENALRMLAGWTADNAHISPAGAAKHEQ